MATELAVVDRAALPQRTTLEPNTLKEAIEFAKIVANSELAPKDYRGKVDNVIVAIQFGKELGVPPMQALQGVAVINGRPSVWGDLMWALVTNHPQFEDAIEKVTDKGAEVTLKRRGRSPVTASFTMEDAQKAGLWGKAGPWTQYPKRQMQWRARTFAARDLFPDALKGMVSTEEVSDYQGATIEGTLAQPSSAPEVTAKATEPAKITDDQAREFAKAWKASGFTVASAKDNLERICGTRTSLDIPADKYEEAMRWATQNPNWPGAAPVISPDEKICREMFGILGYDLTQQAQAISDADGDWTKLATRLNEELPAE